MRFKYSCIIRGEALLFLSRMMNRRPVRDLHPRCEHGETRLTEIQELLHRQRRRGELGEVIDVFGHVGQRCSIHQRPDKLHFASHPHKSIQRIKKLDMEMRFKIFGDQKGVQWQ